MAFTGLAALASGAAVAEGLMTVEALSTLGMAVGVVGGVTGNKNLAKLGAGMSLGSWGAGALGTANTAQQTFRASEISAQNAGQGALEVGAEAAAAPVDAPDTSAGVINTAINNPSAYVETPTPYVDSSPQQTFRGSEINLENQGYITQKQDTTSFLDKINGFGKWIKDNKEMVQAVGGVLTGIQKQDQFNQQMAFNNARLAQTANASAMPRYNPVAGIIQRAQAVT